MRYRSNLCSAGFKQCILFALMLAILATVPGCFGPATERIEASALIEKKRLASFHFDLSKKFWAQGRLDLALRSLDMAVRQDPAAVSPRLKILDLHLINRDAEGAMRYLATCPDELQEQPAFKKRCALVLAIKEESAQAIELWAEVIAEEPDNAPCLLAAAENLLMNGNAREAYDLLKGALARGGSDVEMLSSFADLCRVMNCHDEEAETRLKLVRLLPESVDRLREAVRTYARARLYEEGLQQLGRIVLLNPGTMQSVLDAGLGYLYYCHGDYAEAGSRLCQAFSSPNYVPADFEVLAFAEIQMRNGAYQAAIEPLEQLLDKQPTDGLARAALAWAHHCAGSNRASKSVITEGLPPLRGREILKAIGDELD